jgi:hypothetical protein
MTAVYVSAAGANYQHVAPRARQAQRAPGEESASDPPRRPRVYRRDHASDPKEDPMKNAVTLCDGRRDGPALPPLGCDRKEVAV